MGACVFRDEICTGFLVFEGESGMDQVELGTVENLMYSKPNYDIINQMNY